MPEAVLVAALVAVLVVVLEVQVPLIQQTVGEVQ
jgi:hypothetical protein